MPARGYGRRPTTTTPKPTAKLALIKSRIKSRIKPGTHGAQNNIYKDINTPETTGGQIDYAFALQELGLIWGLWWVAALLQLALRIPDPVPGAMRTQNGHKLVYF